MTSDTTLARGVGSSAAVDAAELHELLSLGRGSPLPVERPPLVHELVAEVARSRARETAVVSDGRSLDYETLTAWAGSVAAELAEAGAGRGSRVGVLAEPSAAMVAGVLGILRVGAAYVPIDPSEPEQRLAELVANARLAAAVATSATGRRLAALDVGTVVELESAASTTTAERALFPPARPDDVAYLIYTSGSTGEPKGVVVEHRQLAASTCARGVVYPGAPVFLLVSPLAFDSSAAGLWGTLTAGGRLVVATAEEVRDPERLAALVEAQRVTQLLCVPSLYGFLLDAAQRTGIGRLRSLETTIVAGEPLSQRLLDRHFALLPHASLVNEYGPTETTVWASYRRYREPGPVSIGGAVPGARLYVLDDELRVVPRGVEGELFVGGAGVARGYFDRPAESARVFLDDPFADTEGARMYRTGDRARWSAEGTLEFLGRRDHQVKVRGQRVELVAVENAVRALPEVRDAVVVPNDGRTHLTAFVVLAADATAEAIRSALRRSLPPAMVPAHVRFVDVFPLTLSGKIDRNALAAVAERAVTPKREPVRAAGPGDAAARAVALVSAAWAEVLKTAEVPTDVNLFDAGGHSLGMFDLQDALERHTGVRPSIVELFRHTTVSAQAGLVGARLEAEGDRRPPAAEAPTPVPERTARWLWCPAPRPSPQVRLVCFPHAGGSASFFREWGAALPEHEVYAVRYPGRAERIDEPMATDLRALAHEVAAAIEPLADRPIALFGHSMGAPVALETARALEGRGVEVAYLFASGSREDPSPTPPPTEAADDDPRALATRLLELGGTDPELASDPEFIELVLPYVTADGRMFHAYELELEPRLRCPVVTIVGDVDTDADRRPWTDLTTGGFTEQIVRGDHFYLIADPPFALLRDRLAPTTNGDGDDGTP